MNAKDVIKTVDQWAKDGEGKAAIVILVENSSEDEQMLCSNAAILGKHNRLTEAIKALLNESEPFKRMVKEAMMKSFIKKIIEK